MPTLSGLFTYPIKSCGGLSHEQIALSATGLTYDRRWLVVDANGEFVTQRQHHHMALIQPRIDGDAMVITAPKLSELRVPLALDGEPSRSVVIWRDRVDAADMGDEAAAWFSEAVGMSVRLVAMPDSTLRPTSTKHTPQAGQVGFADGYPLLVISEASLADLNARLAERGKSPVTMRRFRPNIVITDSAAYDEDRLGTFHIGEVTLEAVKPCARCVMTTVDPETGQAPDPQEPLGTLATYRRGANGGVMFGQNVIHRTLGVLRVGDEVRV